MEQQDKNAANQAGPSSAPPETQYGLKETNKSSEEIIGGARQEDQLEQLKANSGDNEGLNNQPKINDDENA